MNRKQRVLAAIEHHPCDRVPKGELGISPVLRDSLLKGTDAADAPVLEKEWRVRELLNMDLISLHEYPMLRIGETEKGYPVFRGAYGEEFADNGKTTMLLKKAVADMENPDGYTLPEEPACTAVQLDYMKKNTDLFCMTQINGPIGALTWMQGLDDLFTASMECPEQVLLVADRVMDYEIRRAKLFIDHGADAILMAEDIAFNRGLMFPPYVMDKLAWPVYKRMIRRIKEYKDIPVIMHSDGNINDALENIAACGFDGLQSLQPSAGMDIVQVKKEYGDRLCLMGNLDLDRLLPLGTPEEIEQETRRLIGQCGPGSGFILSSCNVLTDAVPAENALAMYRAADTFGNM